MKNAAAKPWLLETTVHLPTREVADLKLTGQQNVSILQQAQLHRYVLDKVCVTYFCSAEAIFNSKLPIRIYYEGTFPCYARVVVSLYLHCSNKNWCILHQHLTRLLRESDSEKRDTFRVRTKSEKDWKWGTLFFLKQTLPKQLAFLGDDVSQLCIAVPRHFLHVETCFRASKVKADWNVLSFK